MALSLLPGLLLKISHTNLSFPWQPCITGGCGEKRMFFVQMFQGERERQEEGWRRRVRERERVIEWTVHHHGQLYWIKMADGGWAHIRGAYITQHLIEGAGWKEAGWRKGETMRTGNLWANEDSLWRMVGGWIERETGEKGSGTGGGKDGWMVEKNKREKNAGVSKSYCCKPQSWQPCHSGDSALQFPCTSFLAHHAVLLSAPLSPSTHAHSHCINSNILHEGLPSLITHRWINSALLQ